MIKTVHVKKLIFNYIIINKTIWNISKMQINIK